MKLTRLITAALGGLVLSCQGPAAVLAQDAVCVRTQAATTGAPRAPTLEEAARPTG